MRDRETASGHDPGGEERALGASYRMGAVLSADRRTRLHEALPRRDDARAAVARIARAGSRRELRDALRREGELLRRVNHPNVAKGYEVGEQEPVGAYLIRERVDGVDLREALRRSGPYSPERARVVALSLANALRALDRAGSTASLEPEDVCIEDGTGRLVVVSAMPSEADATPRMRNRASAQLVADVVIGCLRGRLPADPRERARDRVEVVQARRAGDGPGDVPPELAEIVEVCVGRGADADVPSPSDLADRLDGVQLSPGGNDEDRAAKRRARATELRDMLAVSEELGVVPEDLGGSPALVELLDRADAAPEAEDGSEIEGSLRRARESLGGVLTRAIDERADALEAEWAGFETQARPLLATEDPEEFTDAVRVAREQSGDARFVDAQRALGRAQARLESARDVARSAAMQRARDGVDRLVRRLDALEARAPGTPVDPALEPLRVRADVQALVGDGRFAEALERVESAVAEVERQSAEREASALRATARQLADRAVALRRNGGAASDAPLLDEIERTLSDAVARLGRGDLDGARVASEEAEQSLRRLDWERELAAAEPGAVDGLREIDALRQAAVRARGEAGGETRSELLRRLEALERATHGVWTDAIARLRGIVDRSAWDLLGRALGDLREQILAAAAPEGGVEFHPSPELAEVLRILAEAERDAPAPSATAAARLASIREHGEEMLAQLDPDRAREERPDLVDQLVERCAAAADAERRGEHDRAARELEAANGVLEELLGATGAAPSSLARPVAAESESEREPKSELESGSERESKSGRESRSERESKSERESRSERESKSERGSRAECESNSERESGAEPVLGAGRPDRTRRASDGGATRGPAEPRADPDSAAPGPDGDATARRPTPGWIRALAAVDRRAWLGLALLLFGVAWATWPAVDWWTPPRVSGPSPGVLVGDVALVGAAPTGLFPHIAASAPAAASLPRARLPRELEVVVTRPSSGEEPAVVWWAGDRVIGRGSRTLAVARIPAVVWDGSDFVRVTVGDGLRPEQTRVWSLE